VPVQLPRRDPKTTVKRAFVAVSTIAIDGAYPYRQLITAV